jgi:hypothetical protein
MNIRRGLFRIWLVASVVWALVCAATMWQEFASPYFQEDKYIYLPIGAPKPEGKGIDDFAYDLMSVPFEDADRERAVTLFRDGQAIGHIREIFSDVAISDDRYVARAFPHNLKLWAPASLDSAELGELLNRFEANYLAPRDTEVMHRRFWQLGMIFVPPAVVFLFGAALIWAFSGFRAVQGEGRKPLQ